MYQSNLDVNDSIFTLEYTDSVSPLSRAAREGDLDKIEELISKGSLPQNPDNRGWTAIHFCAAAGQVEALRLILKLKSKSKNYLVNLTTWENITPLLIALKAKSPSLEVIKVLLKSGASPKLYTHTNLSPLHLACMKKGSLKIIKLLVQYGADVNVREDLSLFTPLHVAVCESNDLDIIRYLIDISDLNIKNMYERTAFLEACNLNYVNIVKLFIEKDKKLANVEAEVPPIVYSAIWGNLEMSQLLIESGADINVRCKAVISDHSSDSEMILLDANNFLPIYSSLTNLDSFKLFLKFTDPAKCLEVETPFCSFPLFVLINANDPRFYETLMQSDYPNTLKTLTCRVLVNFILTSPQMYEIIKKKFHLFFKYNFYWEPQNVFQNFVCLMSEEELWKNLTFLKMLAQMGISSSDEFSNKISVIVLLRTFMNKYKESDKLVLAQLTCDLLSESVLTLKQYCRIIVRRHIRLNVKSDWLAIKVIENSDVPESLKKFLLFDEIN